MLGKRKHLIKRAINALLFAIIVFCQYNTAFSIKIIHANPMLPLALLVCCCMFSSEITATLTGLVVGIFIDGLAATPIGFNSILLFIMGLAVSLAAKHLFNNNLLSAITLCAICSTIYFLIRWIFCFAFNASLTENLTYIMQSVFSSVLYTAVISIPFYLLEKLLNKKFSND